MDSIPPSFGSPAIGGGTPFVTSKMAILSDMPVLENLGGCAMPVTDLKTSTKRCNHPACEIKLSMLDKTTPCRCGHVFCEKHRFGDTKNDETSHKCPFDYKAAGLAILEKANQRIVGDKVEKF